jgi:hypothetical protein
MRSATTRGTVERAARYDHRQSTTDNQTDWVAEAGAVYVLAAAIKSGAGANEAATEALSAPRTLGHEFRLEFSHWKATIGSFGNHTTRLNQPS